MKKIKNYRNFMGQYFKDVYGSNEKFFFEKCLFICDEKDSPIDTCFACKDYNLITIYIVLKLKKNMKGFNFLCFKFHR
ncbi:hypothetical protein [Brachyspira intermedia]|uniref:hypothetical protein n=1 Tax=Brachyspira intermedia TaxID=84377 RepID=UPI0030067292